MISLSLTFPFSGDPHLVERAVFSFLKLLFSTKNHYRQVVGSNFGPQNIALHWYTWHQVPWGTNFPNFLPPKVNFSYVVKTLRQYGLFQQKHWYYIQ